MSDDKKVIFSMQKLSKTYQGADKPVLKNIYLSFFYGAKIGILGLNGSGKSSLLKIIAEKSNPCGTRLHADFSNFLQRHARHQADFCPHIYGIFVAFSDYMGAQSKDYLTILKPPNASSEL